ncbi:hypothetical protein GGD64_006151 [Bradyrhizobium sp. CIR3A]|nr:hypothetical protein [Bradyrhizobium sp. CIR3A]NYG45680.1 hypothetical protein [Bradyrhizobium sp. IAR9]
MSRTRCSALCAAAQSRDPAAACRVDAWAPALQRIVEPDDASHRRGDAALRPGHESRMCCPLSPRRHREEPLRRSNPESFRGKILDCFRLRQRLRRTSRCARNDGEGGTSLLLPCALARRHASTFSRLLSPELCCSFRPVKDQRAQGRPGAGGTRGPRAWKNAHGVDYRRCRSPGLPCADGFNGVLRALLGERCTVAPVALRMTDARARSGRRITARLDASLRASGPHDFSVRGRFDLIAES